MRGLRYDVYGAALAEERSHPQKKMRELGITYQHATPQSMGDQWWFWNCENIPNDLPEYIADLEKDPMESIGFGLTKDLAEKIRDYRS